MKKQLLALLGLFLLCGCSAKEEQTFSLTAEEQQAYTETIDDVMEEYYWEYDRASLTFGAAKVPEDTEKNARLFDASNACEYNLKRKAGQDAVLAEAALLHYNGDSAGTLQCWFVGGNLSGVVYSGGYDQGHYSLKERNPFLADGEFQAYENWTGMPMKFTEGNGEFSPEGIYSVGKDANGNTMAVSIQNGAAAVYRYAGGLSRYRNFSYGNGLEAMCVWRCWYPVLRKAAKVMQIKHTPERNASCFMMKTCMWQGRSLWQGNSVQPLAQKAISCTSLWTRTWRFMKKAKKTGLWWPAVN